MLMLQAFSRRNENNYLINVWTDQIVFITWKYKVLTEIHHTHLHFILVRHGPGSKSSSTAYRRRYNMLA